jgi:hypothetical protein
VLIWDFSHERTLWIARTIDAEIAYSGEVDR